MVCHAGDIDSRRAARAQNLFHRHVSRGDVGSLSRSWGRDRNDDEQSGQRCGKSADLVESADIIPLVRRYPTLALIALGTVLAGTASADTAWPSRSTPRGSTLGWFKAINAHNRQRLLFYVVPRARDQMGWATPTASWPRYTDLRCWARGRSTSSNADLRCTFHESASPAEGTPWNFFDVYLHRFKRVWLIVSYGQG